MGFRAKSGTEWIGYPLDCYDYWSNCGAENDSLQFHVTLRLPRLGLLPRHIRHTHRHRLHPVLELLRDYVCIHCQCIQKNSIDRIYTYCFHLNHLIFYWNF